MPLKFDTDAAYERWVRETERAALAGADELPTAPASPVRSPRPSRSSSSEPVPRRLRSRAAREHEHREHSFPVRVILKRARRGGRRRRAAASLRTLLQPFR